MMEIRPSTCNSIHIYYYYVVIERSYKGTTSSLSLSRKGTDQLVDPYPLPFVYFQTFRSSEPWVHRMHFENKSRY